MPDNHEIANRYIGKNTDFDTAARILEAVNVIINTDGGLLEVIDRCTKGMHYEENS